MVECLCNNGFSRGCESCVIIEDFLQAQRWIKIAALGQTLDIPPYSKILTCDNAFG